MKKKKISLFMQFLMLLSLGSVSAQAKTWTLQECIDYAMKNNTSLLKTGLTHQTAVETTLQSKAALNPTMDFSTSHNVNYKPWEADAVQISGSRLQSSVDKVSYNGSYQIGANWTVWNGNRNRNQVKLNRLSEKDAELDSLTQALSLEERITTYYIQILYSKEAINVQKASLEAAKVNEARGEEMFKVGSMSKADLSQLSSTRAQDEYNVVKAESDVRSYTRQLKELLQITNDEEFEVVSPEMTDAMAMQAIPSLNTVYDAAVQNRPEIKKAQLAVETAEMQMKIAKAQRMPTVGLSASASTSNTTLSTDPWATQVKENVSVGGGVNISIPIFEQRTTKTAVNKANIQRQQALLDIKDKQSTLYSTIENYWIQAGNSQNQYKSAKVSTESAQESYTLLSEQFRLGLKNIVELQESKTKLLTAQQSELQSKYNTIFNINMLKFYQK